MFFASFKVNKIKFVGNKICFEIADYLYSELIYTLQKGMFFFMFYQGHHLTSSEHNAIFSNSFTPYLKQTYDQTFIVEICLCIHLCLPYFHIYSFEPIASLDAIDSFFF